MLNSAYPFLPIAMCDLVVRAYAHPTGLAGFTIRSMMCLRYKKTSTRFPSFILSAVLIWKVNITAITTLDTDWPQEAIPSYIGNWILNVGQIVPLSESHCSFVLDFAKYTSDFILSGVCM